MRALLCAALATALCSCSPRARTSAGPSAAAGADGAAAVHAVVIRLTVSDVPRSVDWYVQHLGLVKTAETYDEWARLEVTGVPGLSVGLKRVQPPEGTGGQVTTFVVPDIAAIIARLRAAGIEVEDPRQLSGGVQLAFVHDPDGNVLAVRQNPPER